MKRKAQVQRGAGDLRRSVSMNHLHRRAFHPNAMYQGLVDLDGDVSGCDGATDSANASGYLASTGTGGYMAASGNSVGITSTTGTTSTAGVSFRNLKLPVALQERIQSQVVTSRKAAGTVKENERDQGKKGTMGPPVGIPERPNGLLRKCKSTNTLRLPKREEGSKPGYCESCRMKFDEFKSVRVTSHSGTTVVNVDFWMQNIRGRRHRKFATDDSNFLQLDGTCPTTDVAGGGRREEGVGGKTSTLRPQLTWRMRTRMPGTGFCHNLPKIWIRRSVHGTMRRLMGDGDVYVDLDG